MNSAFETILVQGNLNPFVKLEPYENDPNENSNYTAAEESKIGEIFHVKKDHFKFVCTRCLAEFSLLIQFTAHAQQHLQEIYSDSVDTKVFNDLDSVDVKPLHLDCIADFPIASATECDSDSTSPKKRRKLKKTSSKCLICKRKYGSKKTLERHIQATHSTTKIEPTSISEGICGMGSNANPSNTTKSGEFQQYNDDQQIVIKGNRIGERYQKCICEICNLEFGSKQSLTWHMRHKHEPNGRFAQKLFECYLCRRQFNRQREIKKHFRKEHLKKLDYREYRYCLRTCKLCGVEFNDLHLLVKHKVWHKEQLKGRQHKCEVCEKTFVQRFELGLHMATHSARNFKCDLCDKAFKSKKSKNWHARVHEAHRGVQCDQCGKVLADTHKLGRHLLTHTGEKPFACEYCHKQFRQKGNLDIHKRSHTGDYIHYCKPCEKGFGYRRELRRHNFRVHGIEMVENDTKLK